MDWERATMYILNAEWVFTQSTKVGCGSAFVWGSPSPPAS